MIEIRSAMDEIVKILKNNGIGILATDTICGFSGSAFSKKAVERIYRLKKRNKEKPFIILIGSIDDLFLFGIKPSSSETEILKKIWPGKISVLLDCPGSKFSYLHRGTKKLAFRLPVKKSLLALLKKTGPLVSTSANISGLPPAKNIKETQKVFGNKVDFYYGKDNEKGLQSTLIKINNGKVEVLREGARKIPNYLILHT